MSTKKQERIYYKALRRLAKLETFKTLKVTVCEGEFNEEKNQILVAPLMHFDSYKDLENKNSNSLLNEKSIENSAEQTDISNGKEIEPLDDYPNSSDFSDDE